jgi:hypothetical protein
MWSAAATSESCREIRTCMRGERARAARSVSQRGSTFERIEGGTLLRTLGVRL